MVAKMNESGFCVGVRNAVDKAILQYENISSGKSVYLYGDLVNNVHVMQELKNKGFCVTDNIKAIPGKAIAVIRAHGVPRAVYDELKAKDVDIVDCTCVRVERIHRIVSEKSSAGYKIVVVGKRDHPEVIGTVGWCSDGSAHVAESEVDLSALDLSGKICVVAQTTCNRELWDAIAGFVSAQNASAEINDTLCNVTSNREEKAKAIAKASDVMLIIGDNNSSNSRELFRRCHESCEKTFFISSASDLGKNAQIFDAILNCGSVGLAASASAPDEIISEAYEYLMFIDFLKTARKEIEDASHKYLNDFGANVLDNSYVHDALKSLCSQNNGGKRIRGTMIKLGERIASHGASDNYLPIAVGYELFQTAILIHDDIIDNSDVRRKKATIHVESAQNLKNVCGCVLSDESANHFGVSRALCVGDYGFFISFQFLSKCDIDPSLLTKIYQLYSQILTTTCEGEIMDVLMPYDGISPFENYEEYRRIVTQIYEYKTAWYTLAGPIMLGAICGGASGELLDLLKSISIPLGVAFQIKDDLLGIYSSSEVMGKSILSDICESKQTLLFGFAYKNASSRQRILLDCHYGKKDADEGDLQIIREVFEATGAKKYAEDEIQRLSNCSRGLIANDMIDSEYQSVLNGLISYLIGREY